MTSRFIPSAIQLAPAEPVSRARTIGVAACVIAAHLALLAVYTASQSSGSPGLRQAPDSAALDAVSGAVCEPYLERGEAVPVSVVQAIDFKLTRP